MPGMRLPVFCCLVLALVGCGRQASWDPTALRVVRDYGFDTATDTPEAEWHPSSYLIMSRSVKGVMLVQEGYGRQHFYGTSDKVDVHDLRWLDENRFIFGPKPGAKTAEDGSLILPNYGLRVGTVIAGELRGIVPLTESGSQPRPWGEQLIASVEDRLVLVDRYGREKDLERGFNAEPQPDGDGIAFRTVPLDHTDHWTGMEQPGDLIVRWGKEQVDMFPAGRDVVWIPGGGLLYAIAAADAPGKLPQVLHVAGAGKGASLVAAPATDPAPHPGGTMLAFVDGQGRVVVADIADASRRKVISDAGRRPRWSHDGKRLLVEEAHAEDEQARHLHVYVLQAE